jgi:CBS-domain-containing membrane protein
MKTISELMIPIESYPTVPEDATLLDDIFTFEKAGRNNHANRQPFRAILVTNQRGEVVGKIDQITFLKALEPKHFLLDDLCRMSQIGVDERFTDAVTGDLDLFRLDLPQLCYQARNRKVGEVMLPLTEEIDIEAPLVEAVQKLIMKQTASVLVKDRHKIVGLIRLADLCQEVAREMKHFAVQH